MPRSRRCESKFCLCCPFVCVQKRSRAKSVQIDPQIDVFEYYLTTGPTAVMSCTENKSGKLSGLQKNNESSGLYQKDTISTFLPNVTVVNKESPNGGEQQSPAEIDPGGSQQAKKSLGLPAIVRHSVTSEDNGDTSEGFNIGFQHRHSVSSTVTDIIYSAPTESSSSFILTSQVPSVMISPPSPSVKESSDYSVVNSPLPGERAYDPMLPMDSASIIDTDASSHISFSRPRQERFPLLTWETYKDVESKYGTSVPDVPTDLKKSGLPISNSSTISPMSDKSSTHGKGQSFLTLMAMTIPEHHPHKSGGDVIESTFRDKVLAVFRADVCHACVSCFFDGTSFFQRKQATRNPQQRSKSLDFPHLPEKPSSLLHRVVKRRNTVTVMSQSEVMDVDSMIKQKLIPRMHDLPGFRKERQACSTSVDCLPDPCPDDFFDFLKILGSGSYGKVYLAKLRKTGELLAVKVQLTLQRKRAETELKVFTIISYSPFIVLLHSHFSTLMALYLVMEYLPGGKLTQKLTEPFSVAATAFYSAQIVMALTHLHNENILYRDLKPDNILLTQTSYIKLCDFGTCCFGVMGNRKVKVSTGTPRYWAPEKFQQQPYGRASDWWSLGVIVYQMLMGKHPFVSVDTTCNFDTYKEMVVHNYPVLRPTLNTDAISLCQGLLVKDPKERLGGAETRYKVYKHPFFRHFISWGALRAQKMRPPPMYAFRSSSMPTYRR